MADPMISGKRRSPRRARREGPEPAFPAWKAFLVQFTTETGSAAGVFSGRAEHMLTGQRSRFESVQALVDFVTTVLDQPPSTRRGTVEGEDRGSE